MSWSTHKKSLQNHILLQAQFNIVDMAHTALGQLEELKKKELLLSALMMSHDEFKQLAADQENLIVDSSSLPNTVAPNPASLLIVDSVDNTTVNMLDNEGQVMVDEGQFSIATTKLIKNIHSQKNP